MVSGLPPLAAPFVAQILAQAGYELASISGLTANAVAFADAWRVATAAKTTVEIEEQLYRLGTLHSPAEVIGKPRAANRDDIDLLTDWFDQFHVEAFGFAFPPRTVRALPRPLTPVRHAHPELGGRAVSNLASRTQPGASVDRRVARRAGWNEN